MRAYVPGRFHVVSQVWAAYIRVVARDDDQHQIAAAAGVNQSTASRWKRGEKTPTNPANVAAFARAYHRNVLEAFVAAGLLAEEDAGRGLPRASKDLLAELRLHDESPQAVTKAAFKKGLNRKPQVEPESPPTEKVKRIRRKA